MCRWLAYSGPRLSLNMLLFEPENSLIRQSLAARRSVVPTNGDGFGLGWYDEYPEPGLFRDTLPAWNDSNLKSIARHVRSGLFFAHVRASTGTSTSRDNCHPFVHGHGMFMHNGAIGGYSRIRRDLEHLIPTDLYAARQGTTDTEAFFLLALGHGLLEEPGPALARTVALIEDVMAAQEIREPLRAAIAFSDGKTITALRYSSDSNSPSLYYLAGGDLYMRDGRISLAEGEDTILILSEPLDGADDLWSEVPDASLITARGSELRVTPFTPAHAPPVA
ncbi:MAG: class II glutamine amidotransferase [Alphaproteobacteria bacterium]|nr:class II glutamine amidotransferase [Alphaproteobacteria bacterium]